MEERIEIIAETYLFRNIKEAAYKTEFTAPVTFKKGEIIYDENDFRKCIGIVLSGRVKAVPLSKEGVLSFFKTGDVFGAAAVFSSEAEYVSRIEAVKDCTVQFIDESCLISLFGKYPTVAANYISFLSGRIRFLNQKLSIMMNDGAEAKLFEFLTKNDGYKGNMSALAKTLCMGRTSLYRCIETLEQKKLISRCGGEIKVIL